MPCECKYGSGGIGSRLGAQAGGILGDYAEQLGRSAFARFFGSGDYTLQSNSLVLGGGVSADVQIMPAGDHKTRIMYREYLGDVVTGPSSVGQFYQQSIRINPGNLAFAPWLATIAQNYDQWVANGIVFEFRSMSSDYTAAAALGSVIFATQYDMYEPPFANKQEMLNTSYANEAKPTDRIVHGVECALDQTPNWIKYVRSGQVQANDPQLAGDLDEFDLGIFTWATQGSGAPINTPLGSLYVYYDITLMKEKPYNGIPTRGPLNMRGDSGAVVAGVYTNATPLNALIATTWYSIGNCFYGTVASNRLYFPVFTNGATWEVTILWYGSVAAAIAYPALSYIGGTQQSLILGPQPANNGNSAIMQFVFKQTSWTCEVAFGAGTLPTGNQNLILQIRQVTDRTTVYH